MTEREHLTTGWEPETPSDDTLLRQSIYAMAGATAAVVEPLGGAVERRPDFIATDLGRPATFSNMLFLLQPHDSAMFGQLQAFTDEFFFSPQKSGMVVLASAWPTPDLHDAGWQLMGHPPLHLRLAGGASSPHPAGIEIGEADSVESLYDWERCAIEGYPLDEMLPWRPGLLASQGLLDDPRQRIFLARLNGEVVGVANAYVDYGLNYVALVATMPSARGHGIGSALTWHATLADPSLPAVLLSSDDGRPVYQRMGYIPLLRFTLWYRMRDI